MLGSYSLIYDYCGVFQWEGEFLAETIYYTKFRLKEIKRFVYGEDKCIDLPFAKAIKIMLSIFFSSLQSQAFFPAHL